MAFQLLEDDVLSGMMVHAGIVAHVDHGVAEQRELGRVIAVVQRISL
jgi:hypothetical protein